MAEPGAKWVNGHDEQREAKSWAVLNAQRMKSPLVVIASADGNSEAHLGYVRAWIARRPVMFALLLVALGALAGWLIA